MLNLHHLPHTLDAVVGDGSDLGMRVRYSWENPVLGSAGGPRQALPLLGASTFLIVNGDTLTDVDVNALVAAHHALGRAGDDGGGRRTTKPEKYGGIVASADGAVTGFAKRGSTRAVVPLRRRAGGGGRGVRVACARHRRTSRWRRSILR